MTSNVWIGAYIPLTPADRLRGAPRDEAGRRITLTSNGEIYNNQLLRSELERQCRCETRSA